nr:SurA N-terminal domain-containing protein [Nocardioidaceae bacterium]
MIAQLRSHVAKVGGTTSLALAALFGLSACGDNLQPGAAATVGDIRIPQDDVDDIVGAACEFTQIVREQGAGGEPQRLDELRSTITTALIQFEIVDEAARDQGVSASQAAVSKIEEQIAKDSPIPDAVSADHAEALEGFFDRFAMSQAQQAAIGANIQDSKVTSISEVTQPDLQAGAEYLSEVTQKKDVVVNPAYGRWDGKAVVAGDGSLSDPVSDAALGGDGDESADPAAPAES